MRFSRRTAVNAARMSASPSVVSPRFFVIGAVQAPACFGRRRAASTRKADEGGIPGRMSTEESAARCVPERRER
jgi:hypothetical protein